MFAQVQPRLDIVTVVFRKLCACTWTYSWPSIFCGAINKRASVTTAQYLQAAAIAVVTATYMKTTSIATEMVTRLFSCYNRLYTPHTPTPAGNRKWYTVQPQWVHNQHYKVCASPCVICRFIPPCIYTVSSKNMPPRFAHLILAKLEGGRLLDYSNILVHTPPTQFLTILCAGPTKFRASHPWTNLHSCNLTCLHSGDS